MTPTDDHTKAFEAVQRAVPITRMVDYGVPLGDALRVHATPNQLARTTWDMACSALAMSHTQAAQAAAQQGAHATAAWSWRSASALWQCAQLAYTQDTARKRELYASAHGALASHASLAGDMAPKVIRADGVDLYTWEVRPATPAHGWVLVLGGLSGWGGVYLGMGRALALRGLAVTLVEGPGQGLTRMWSQAYATANRLALLRACLDDAAQAGAQRFGVWGNSFGGLFASHLAVQDHRVSALCVNGAPMAPTWPDFRTPREQMLAAFGLTQEGDAKDALAQLALTPGRHVAAADVLVLEGGQDPLVPLGSQKTFWDLAPGQTHDLMTWPDGEHTLYNHAEARNAHVADWFAQRLGPGRTP
jgi:alpha-beta hydrolase superfamily lysophospholipase